MQFYFKLIDCLIIVLFGCDRKEIIMKKILILFITMVLISGCSMNNKEVDGVDNAAAPNVMINNRLYHTTGELYDGRFFNEADENDRNQQYEVDGLITSTVEGYMLPEKNNQSIFGVDCEYHIIDDENILVKIDDLWIRFEYGN